MLATGGLLTSIALLMLAALVPVFRSSDPPRWTTRGWIGELVTVSIVCTLALGLGCLGAGAIDAFQTGPDGLDLGLLALVLLASFVIWRRLQAARAKAVGPCCKRRRSRLGIGAQRRRGRTAAGGRKRASATAQGGVADVGGVPSLRDWTDTCAASD